VTTSRENGKVYVTLTAEEARHLVGVITFGVALSHSPQVLPMLKEPHASAVSSALLALNDVKDRVEFAALGPEMFAERMTRAFAGAKAIAAKILQSDPVVQEQLRIERAELGEEWKE